MHLTQRPPENHCCPAVDVLLRTAAAHYGSSVLAVVLTGMGSDGLAGSRLIRAQGGTVLAQDQATSVIWGMPGAVARAGLAQRILSLQDIAPEILRISTRAQGGRTEMRETVAL
jgi:two-component system chemotaxis response regulator CheB